MMAELFLGKNFLKNVPSDLFLEGSSAADAFVSMFNALGTLDISAAGISIIQGLLQVEDSKRLGSKNVRSHPFFSSVDWVELGTLVVPLHIMYVSCGTMLSSRTTCVVMKVENKPSRLLCQTKVSMCLTRIHPLKICWPVLDAPTGELRIIFLMQKIITLQHGMCAPAFSLCCLMCDTDANAVYVHCVEGIM